MADTTPARRDDATPGIRLGRVFGVDLYADWSLALIFALITVNLGGGLFPRAHPEWSPLLSWGLALVAAASFFASIALHELSHAVVGRRNGIPVRRITLFIFGGMAHMEREPPSPKSEFLMAAVGPAVSLAIGAASLVAGMALSREAIATHADDPVALVHALGPLPTLLVWLGPTNITLGLFNLVPGFPLDGGRVLRAALWWITGDLRAATRWAAGAGQAVAWVLMAAGASTLFGFRVPVLGGGGAGRGLWLILIGWFLNNAARASERQLQVRLALEHVPVREVMRARVDTVAPEVSLAEFVRDVIMNSDQHEFPVVTGGDIVGLVRMDDVRRVGRDRWNMLSVADVMTPVSELRTLRPDDEALDALRELADREQVPVVDGRHLVGVARRQDIMKWLSLPSPA